MDRVAKTLASYALWSFIFVTVPILWLGAVLVWVTTVAFDRRLRALHIYSCAWASLYTYFFPYWRVSVRNRDLLRNDAAYVVVSNHQSLLDILVLFRLYRHFKWVSKIEMFRIPCIGWNMWMNRYVALRRGDRSSVTQMMRSSEQTLAEGNVVLLLAEPARAPVRTPVGPMSPAMVQAHLLNAALSGIWLGETPLAWAVGGTLALSALAAWLVLAQRWWTTLLGLGLVVSAGAVALRVSPALAWAGFFLFAIGNTSGGKPSEWGIMEFRGRPSPGVHTLGY